MKREALVSYLNGLLEPMKFRDYCPNGLQVEGREEIQRIVTGVTASQDLIDAAIAEGADAVLVHHGYFWKGEDGSITGIRRKRLGTLIQHNISLLAYHLPLDAHPMLGNNAQLANLLDWLPEGRFGDQEIGWFGRLGQPTSLSALSMNISEKLGREPLVIGDDAQHISKIAWCSGGAQSYLEQAILLGVDCYVSGEISEQTVHLAKENGVAYIAAGHHATERYGVKALGEHLAEKFNLDCRFVDLTNPV